MPKPKNALQPRESVIAQRRKLVSQLRARGNSLDDIHRALMIGGQIINPDTGKPYSRGTIQTDLEVIAKEWREETLANVDEHVTRQYSEIQEIKKQAWFDRNPELALKALNLEMKLLGTVAPMKLNIDIAIINRLMTAIEQSGRDPNPVLLAMVEHLESSIRD